MFTAQTKRQLNFHYNSLKHKEEESKVQLSNNETQHKSVRAFKQKMELHGDIFKSNYINHTKREYDPTLTSEAFGNIIASLNDMNEMEGQYPELGLQGK